ncbi:hypothetical protein ADUPG1_004338, partial [Aduncisulcus paluster]
MDFADALDDRVPYLVMPLAIIAASIANPGERSCVREMRSHEDKWLEE